MATRRTLNNLFFLTLSASLILAALFVGRSLSDSQVVIEAVNTLGYPAIVLAGLAAGLNVVAPVPAATLTPVFTAAGFSTMTIISALAFGTLLADFVGYMIGHSSRPLLQQKHPKLIQFANKLSNKHPAWIIGFVAIYAAFIPFPNEAILIPLALGGVSWRLLISPLLIGAVIIQTLLVYGVTWTEVFF